MRTRAFAVGVAAALASGGLLAACGDSSGGPGTPTATAVAAGPSLVDPCLVGTWKSTSITGALTIGGASIPISGGAGEVLSVDASGRLRTDDTNTAPVGGRAPDGTDYRVAQTGTATGTMESAGGRVKVIIDQPTTLTVTLYRNGSAVRQQHPGSANDTYSCTPRTSFTITGAGGTVTTYAPG